MTKGTKLKKIVLYDPRLVKPNSPTLYILHVVAICKYMQDLVNTGNKMPNTSNNAK